MLLLFDVVVVVVVVAVVVVVVVVVELLFCFLTHLKTTMEQIIWLILGIGSKYLSTDKFVLSISNWFPEGRRVFVAIGHYLDH